MDIVRKIGTGVVMIIPGFVLGGLVWGWFGSWIVVLILEILVALTYTSIIAGWPVTKLQRV